MNIIDTPGREIAELDIRIERSIALIQVARENGGQDVVDALTPFLERDKDRRQMLARQFQRFHGIENALRFLDFWRVELSR